MKVRRSDLVYQDLIYTQVLGTYLRLKERCALSHKPCSATHMENHSIGNHLYGTVTAIIKLSPLLWLSRTTASRGYHNTRSEPTSEIIAKSTATNDLEVRVHNQTNKTQQGCGNTGNTFGPS